MQRDIAIVAFPGAQSLDIAGPYEVFAGPPGYQVRVFTPGGMPIRCESGLGILADGDIAQLGRVRCDTLVIAGGRGVRAAAEDESLVASVSRAARRARRIASVCTGTFLLARTGMLEGRRVTTHWAHADLLARTHPELRVDPDPIWIRDENVYTSAGVTAGIDLALALVEEDLGRDVALTVARHLVVFLRRPANQAQLSAQLRSQLADRDVLREIQQHVVENPAGDLGVEVLAARAGFSPRHFARIFREEVGLTPGRYVERVRLEAARRRLEDSGLGVEQVARECGFASAESMRRSFIRCLAVSPTEYRRRNVAA